jgi:pilus assembly protein Flp/PilA
MAQLISRFSKDETAATAVEHSPIAAGIALAIVAVVQAIGTQVQAPYATVSSALKQAGHRIARIQSSRLAEFGAK